MKRKTVPEIHRYLVGIYFIFRSGICLFHPPYGYEQPAYLGYDGLECVILVALWYLYRRREKLADKRGQDVNINQEKR